MFDFCVDLCRAFGVVYKAIHKSTGIILAVKSLPAGDHPEEIRNEIAILQKCNDPNIVSYLGSMLKMPKLWVTYRKKNRCLIESDFDGILWMWICIRFDQKNEGK